MTFDEKFSDGAHYGLHTKQTIADLERENERLRAGIQRAIDSLGHVTRCGPKDDCWYGCDEALELEKVIKFGGGS